MTTDQNFKNVKERLQKVMYVFHKDQDHATAVKTLLEDAPRRRTVARRPT